MNTVELVAGRELDALIAEKVMGLIPCQAKVPNGWPLHGQTCYAQPGSPTKGGELRPYSTDIAAAWEVIEKLEADGILACVGRLTIGWNVIFADWEKVLGKETRASAPEAICLAALNAVSP